ncbi:MAG: cytochrome b/b6 domain-containing protein [Nitriliruptorales bacterium]|nr:cytochrome b/b6 domain-containing protein [Nitriliruptorales bacterium]
MAAHVSDEPSYGLVARTLHWVMFLALVAQFLLGWSIERADGLLEGLVDRWLGGEQDLLVVAHAALGAAIIVLALVRLGWRRFHGLPPWAAGLSAFERRLASTVERVLYTLMFAIPVSGLALLFGSGEDWDLGDRRWEAPLELADDEVLLAVHIATHVIFFVTLALHVGLVLKHQLIDRDRLLRRML